MKTYILDIFPRIKRYSKKLDAQTLLINQHWVLIDDESLNRIIFIFRDNNNLIISTNGIAEKGQWEDVGDNSLLIQSTEGSYLFKHGFIDEKVLVLKIDSRDECAVFINESKFNEGLNSGKVIEYLRNNYLDTPLNTKGPKVEKTDLSGCYIFLVLIIGFVILLVYHEFF